MKIDLRPAIFVLLMAGTLLPGCQHEPMSDLLPPTEEPPTGGDQPCSPDSVYFVNQVLPIFLASCAISGCHDQQTASDGVVLTGYSRIMEGIRPRRPNDSEYFEVLLESDPDDLMPRDPATGRGFSLPADQIETIRDWIVQGAKNNICAECDNSDITFSGRIQPLISLNCASSPACHGSGSGQGDFTTYAGVKAKVDNGTFENRVLIQKTMPPAGALSDCDLTALRGWLDAGAPNN